jgi:flagellar biosynthesis anti-sigma factor FlgM
MEIRSQSSMFQPLDAVVPASNTRVQNGSSTSGQQSLSSDVANLGLSQMLSGDDVRTDRVYALQSQISSGSYHVPAQDVASKLLDTMAGQG